MGSVAFAIHASESNTYAVKDGGNVVVLRFIFFLRAFSVRFQATRVPMLMLELCVCLQYTRDEGLGNCYITMAPNDCY